MSAQDNERLIISKRATAVSFVYKTQIIFKQGMYTIIVLNTAENEVWNIPGETYTRAEAEAREAVVIRELQRTLDFDMGRAIRQSQYSWFNEED